MRSRPIIVSALAAVLLVMTGTAALSQGNATAPDTTTPQPVTNERDDGFDLGWLGLLGLAGLAGLKKPKRESHVVDRTNWPQD